MAKTESTQQAETAPELDLTLDEFCSRLSRTDRRVELIGAFASSERRAGTVKATETEFSARFKAFITAPA